MADHVWETVPQPTFDRRSGRYVPRWNSVALFFNLTAEGRPGDFRDTSVRDARNWLDEGQRRSNPTISEFMTNYWARLSYGRFGFGVDTPRDASGTPLIPRVAAPGGNAAPNGDAGGWDPIVGLINACLDANAGAIWRAAGSLTKDGRHYIPSVVLVHNYRANMWAWFGWTRTVAGQEYEIGRFTHISYQDTFINLPGVPPNRIRDRESLAHEYGHNFISFLDLYHPQGCTGYWDLLGDSSPSGRLSEVCSVHKERIGWISFREEVRGPSVPERTLSLRPYTQSGDAIKVIPDPEHNPAEYFVLEYRKSTGNELWQPDRVLPEQGLLILHMNERLGGVASTYLLNDAPYFDPEFADFSDNGGALWTGHDRLSGILYPQGGNDSFTSESRPSSRFYGGRSSGLRITNIRVTPEQVTFRLSIDCRTEVGWTVGERDRGVAGRFTPDSRNKGQEIFLRNDSSAALLKHREAQWFVWYRRDNRIDRWELGPDDREVVGDLDGDGLDELYLRSTDQAGVLKWESLDLFPDRAISRFRSITEQRDSVDGWSLGPDQRELAADLDGDGRAEIYIRHPRRAGVLELAQGRLGLRSIQNDRIDGWDLGPDDREWVGRFTQGRNDEIFVRSARRLGLLDWDPARRALRSRQVQQDRIDDWDLASSDQHYVGDFDGDGLHEIYVRSPQRAGVLKWTGDRFRLMWSRRADIRHRIANAAPATIALTERESSYSGRFLPARDGILHRSADAVTVLTWEMGEMRIRQHKESSFDGLWRLAQADKFVLGDFQRIGPNIGDPAVDQITDHLTNVFIHNSWRTGMIGVNHLAANDSDQIGLTWINEYEILKEKAAERLVPIPAAPGPIDWARVTEFLLALATRRWIRDPLTGVDVPFPIVDPETCPACIFVLLSGGHATDIVAKPDGTIRQLSISGGDVVAFDMRGGKQEVVITTAQANGMGRFSAFSGFSRLREEGGDVRGLLLTKHGKLRAVIAGPPKQNEDLLEMLDAFAQAVKESEADTPTSRS